MNTPAHLIFGAAAFARPDQRRTLPAALLGGFAPDLSLYVMVGWHLLILETPAQVVFDVLYYSEAWRSVFAVDNSAVLWGAALGLALWRGGPALVAFSAAGLLHIALDFPLHAGDGRPHFWPLTDWIFDSPVSYWDSRFYGRIAGPVELALCAGLTVLLLRRFAGLRVRVLLILLLFAQLMASNIWFLVF